MCLFKEYILSLTCSFSYIFTINFFINFLFFIYLIDLLDILNNLKYCEYPILAMWLNQNCRIINFFINKYIIFINVFSSSQPTLLELLRKLFVLELCGFVQMFVEASSSPLYDMLSISEEYVGRAGIIGDLQQTL